MPKPAVFFIPAIILATIFSYLNSFQNQFVFDDEDFVVKNSTIQDWHKWPHVFTENMIQGARKGSNFYRPLQSLTHGVDYILWKDKPQGHHAFNILFHILAAITAYMMLKAVFSREASFLAALFFAVHPVHTEVITYISGRSEPMAAFFILLAVLLFSKNIVLSCVSFILAILSKESAFIAPALIMLYSYFSTLRLRRIARTISDILRAISPFIIIGIIYGVLRLTVLNFSNTVGANLPQPYFYVPLYLRFLTFLKTLHVYFSILLWPFGLHMERQIGLARSIFELQVFSGLSIFVSLFFIAVRIKKWNNAVLFSVCWFFIAMFPYSNIIPINALIYEHWLYLPSIGFFLFIAWLLEELIKKGKVFKYAAIALAVITALFYMWRTYERNKEWRDPISFYESTIKYAPDSARLHNNLAMAYADKGRLDDAIKEYKKAIESGDYYPQTHYNLSNIYLQKNDYENAIKELKRSIEIDSSFLYTHESLALIYFNQKSFSEARKEAGYILNVEPDNKIAGQILKRLLE
ncbi:MAG: tetratricopeptide repeat protein [Candidatus Omnitrophota bacterium]